MGNRKIKPWEELTFQDDYMFKRTMQNKNLCKKMLEKVLGVAISEIKYLENERTIKTAYGSKGIRLDVYVEDNRNTVYNVEMQMNSHGSHELCRRMRYYQATVDSDLLMAGMKYKNLKDTFIIFICPFVVMDGKRHIYTFRNFCVEDRSMEMLDGATKIILSTKGTMDDVSADMKAFLDYVDGILGEDDFVQEIDREIRDLKSQEKERVAYMTYAMKIQEEREEAQKESRFEDIKNLMKNTGWSIEKAMDALSIPMQEREEYIAMAN